MFRYRLMVEGEPRNHSWVITQHMKPKWKWLELLFPMIMTREATPIRYSHILGFGSTKDGPVSIRLGLPVPNQVGRDARCRSAGFSKDMVDCSTCAGGPDIMAWPESWHIYVVTQSNYPWHPLVCLPVRLENWYLDDVLGLRLFVVNADRQARCARNTERCSRSWKAMLTTVHCRQSSKAKTLEIRLAAALDTIRSSHVASVICLSSCATRRTDTSTLLRARYPQIAQAEKMTILYLASSDSFPNVKPTILHALLSLNPNWQSNRKRAMRLHSQPRSRRRDLWRFPLRNSWNKKQGLALY
jgi:hypothetical protein